MANDSQREKARAMFGKAFFENSKAQPNPKNAAFALQQRANARPIPTYKVGGVVQKPDMAAAKRAADKGAKRAMKAEQDFSGLLGEAADRAARKGTPVMKEGGPTDEYTAKRVRARMEAGNYKDGGEVDRYKAKLDRKKADIEKDYQKALSKGKNADVAKAKYEQRMADAADDYAKWTKGDRSQTKAAEKAAEKNLSMTRKSARNSPTGAGAKTSEALVKKAETSMSQPLSSVTVPSELSKISVSKPSKPAPRKAAAPVRKVTPVKKREVSGSQQTIQNKQGQVQGTKQGPSQGPAQGAKQGPAQGAKQGPAAAPKKNDPFAKDSKGNYLDTSGAGSRARFGASIGSKLTAPFRAVAEYNPASLALKAALAGSDPRAKAAQQKAKAADDAAVMKKNAERVARLRSAGREMDARFYEKNPRALKDGGVGKYAAGGAGKVRKGQMKGK